MKLEDYQSCFPYSHLSEMTIIINDKKIVYWSKDNLPDCIKVKNEKYFFNNEEVLLIDDLDPKIEIDDFIVNRFRYADSHGLFNLLKTEKYFNNSQSIIWLFKELFYLWIDNDGNPFEWLNEAYQFAIVNRKINEKHITDVQLELSKMFATYENLYPHGYYEAPQAQPEPTFPDLLRSEKKEALAEKLKTEFPNINKKTLAIFIYCLAYKNNILKYGETDRANLHRIIKEFWNKEIGTPKTLNDYLNENFKLKNQRIKEGEIEDFSKRIGNTINKL
jgi:hypothetical protein